MISSPKSRRLVYVPGLISLSLLLPLAMSALDRFGALKKLRALEVNWYSAEHAGPYDLPFPPVRKYQVFVMNGNKQDYNTKLDFARIAIREMLATNDTINGIRIHFTDTARYDSFVRALDICKREEGLTYAAHKSDIWILNLKSAPILHGCILFSHPICGTFMHLPATENRALHFPFRYHFNTKFWPIFLILLILAGLNFRKRS